MPSVTHFRVLDCKVYILIEKEYRVQSQKLVSRVEVGILIEYEEVRIYRVYMSSRTRDKIVHSFHVRFDKGGLITELDFEAIEDEMVCC